jgi:hypothetical protein
MAKIVDEFTRFARVTATNRFAHLANAPTTRIAHAADAYIYTGIYRVTGPGVDFDYPPTTDDDHHIYFDGLGSNVFWHKWSKIASKAPSTDTEDFVKTVDIWELPGPWPADPDETPHPVIKFEEYASWGAIGDPVMILRWDVAGGFTYVS